VATWPYDSYLYKEEPDLVDPATEIKEKCAEDHCPKYKAKLDECNERVSNMSTSDYVRTFTQR
jgi:hypothetical protein